MKNRIKLAVLVMVVVCLLMLPLVAACATATPIPPAEEKIFNIGMLNDFSGAISCCGVSTDAAIKDYLRYVQDKKLVPGWRFELIIWDTRYDVARDAPGYRYLLDKGANVIISPYAQDSETVKPLCLADKILSFGYNSTEVTKALPSWTFTQVPTTEDVNATFFNWVIQKWDYNKAGRKPIVAQISWDNSMGQAGAKGAETFCKRVSDKLDWAGSIVLPPGTMDVTQPATELNRKKVDYVFSTMVSSPTISLLKEKINNSYSFKVGTGDWGFVCFPALRERAGKALVGLYWISSAGYPGDGSEGMKALQELYLAYHPATDLPKMDDICYNSGYVYASTVVKLVQNTLKAKGDPYKGDDMYNQAIKLEVDTKGVLGPLKWTETGRTGMTENRMYEVQVVGDTVKPVMVDDWFKMISYK